MSRTLRLGGGEACAFQSNRHAVSAGETLSLRPTTDSYTFRDLTDVSGWAKTVIQRMVRRMAKVPAQGLLQLAQAVAFHKSVRETFCILAAASSRRL